jgi:hypothetical protein
LTHVTRSIDLCHSLVTDSPKNNEPKNKQKPMGIVKLIDQLHRSYPSSLGDSYNDETQSLTEQNRATAPLIQWQIDEPPEFGRRPTNQKQWTGQGR